MLYCVAVVLHAYPNRDAMRVAKSSPWGHFATATRLCVLMSPMRVGRKGREGKGEIGLAIYLSAFLRTQEVRVYPGRYAFDSCSIWKHKGHEKFVQYKGLYNNNNIFLTSSVITSMMIGKVHRVISEECVNALQPNNT